MSEYEEGFFYDLYAFTRSIYIFSHMKTNLVDAFVQKGETVALIILMTMTIFIYFLVLFKILIIVGYFLFFQGLVAFFNFIKLSFMTKFDMYIKSNLIDFVQFLYRIVKKVFTFNFYIFKNKSISTFMIVSFLFTITSNFYFNRENLRQILETEKDKRFLFFYFSSFESNLLMEIMCYIFYSNRNIFFGLLLSLGYFILLNVIILFIHLYVLRREYLDGGYMLEEPQRVSNIIIFLILMILKINCLKKNIKYDKNSK